jgi:hypothetical protein
MVLPIVQSMVDSGAAGLARCAPSIGVDWNVLQVNTDF